MTAMRLLLTRPQEDSERVAAILQKLGHECEIEPLLTIQYHDIRLDLGDIAALIFTSANGVRAFSRLESRRAWPVYAVGEQTKKVAQQMGFTKIYSAGGDAKALAAMIQQHRRPDEGGLFHGAGTIGQGALQEQLQQAGFEIRRLPLYQAKAVSDFSPPTSEKLRSGFYQGLLFFSPRTARLFASLCKKAGMSFFRDSSAYALSPAVAAELQALCFARISTAAQPDLASLLMLIGSIIPPGREK